MRNALLVLVLLGCGVRVVEPTEPRPEPLRPYWPDPGACAGACRRAVELRCIASPERCQAACEAYEREASRAPELGWAPGCMREAADCTAVQACRESVR